MANIKNVKDAILLAKEAGITPWIWGERGIGKSSIVQQLCAENKWGFIDLRCSQIEASDVRGMPDRVDGRTSYLPPDELPNGDMSMDEVIEQLGERPTDTTNLSAVKAYNQKWSDLQKHYPEGILFLDELNRAADDVIQAVFQLVLDRRIGRYTLPPGWGIVVAGNFMEGSYQTNNFTDAAFLDRFSHITLSCGQATVDEWVLWMSKEYGPNAAEVLEFIGSNVQQLDGETTGELGFSIQPSRRSWAAVARVMTVMHNNPNKYESEAMFLLNSGLVGMELARSFLRYSCPIKPREILENGVKPYSKKLQSLERQQLQGLTWGVISYAQNRITEDKIAETCLDYMEAVATECHDKDLAVALGHTLASCDFTRSEDQRTAMAVIGNSSLGKYVMRALEKDTSRGPSSKMFIQRLNERPGLQTLMKNTVWFSDQEGNKSPAKSDGKRK